LEINRELCPEIENLEKYLSGFKLKAKLSGSGPTIFCNVNTYKLAKKISEGYQKFNGDIFICHPQDTALIIL
jgi:4-diphosphocytidyl-2C-methyl-D-erythritol kinase